MKLIGCDGVGDTEPAAEQVDKVVEAGKVRRGHNFAYGNPGLVLRRAYSGPMSSLMAKIPRWLRLDKKS
jgi:hypothetical protein